MLDYDRHEIGKDGEILVLEVSGNLDAVGCEYLYSVIEGEIDDGRKRLIIDCQRLQFISSLGLGMLMRAHSKMKKQGGDVKLARVPGVIADLLSMVMLDRVFHMYPSAADAAASF